MYALKTSFFLCALVPAVASAAWPAGQYTASFVSDSAGGSTGTHGICVVSDKTWYSTTFSSWAGTWFLKGNDLHLHGNYSAGTGNDAFELSREPSNSMTGYWQEWRDDGTFYNFLRTRFAYTGATCAAPAIASRYWVDGDPSE